MKLIMDTRAAVAILMATAMIFGSILLEPLQANASDSAPTPGGDDLSIWTTDFSPDRSVSFQKLAGQSGAPSQEFSSPDTLPSNHLLWSDLGNLGKLEFTLSLPSTVTSWSARLNPMGSHCISRTWSGNYLEASPDVPYLFDINFNCAEAELPNIFQFELTTFVAPQGDTEIGESSEDFVYLVRKPDSQTFILTYESDSQATLPAGDHRWMQVVDSRSPVLDDVSETNLVADRGVALVDPTVFWARVANRYFAGWCTAAGLAGTGTDMDHCFFPGDEFPVYRDTVLFPLWVDDLNPTSITVGDQAFNTSNWIFDRANRTFYLTVDYTAASPIIGAVTVGGQRGVDYNTPSMAVTRLDSDWGMDPDPDTGEYSFVPGCTAADCAEIFVLEGRISAGGRNLGEHYTINLIVSSNLTAEFDVSFDATPGALTPLSLERINELENQPVGWYPIPTGEFARTGYSNESTWLDSVTEAENGWDTYFPVLADETLRLDWYSAPSVYAPTSATIYRGDSQVATATSDEYDLPLTWGLIDTEDFSISNSGQITANPQLAVGTYTFFIEAKDRWMTADEPFQMTVTVVERSQVGGSENTNLPPTNQTGAGQHLPKPGSKLQADLISKVSRSKLAVGGTAQFSVTGGEPGATRFFESKNTGVCSITARGLVTAKSTGVCLISATATAQDPVFAPASAPLTKIAVLGPGLINNAKVTVLKGQVSIKASLLKSLAGKSVKLAIEVKRGGKWVLVPMRSEVLSKSATATFKSFAKPRPGTRVVLLIGGRAVYALTL